MKKRGKDRGVKLVSKKKGYTPKGEVNKGGLHRF